MRYIVNGYNIYHHLQISLGQLLQQQRHLQTHANSTTTTTINAEPDIIDFNHLHHQLSESSSLRTPLELLTAPEASNIHPSTNAFHFDDGEIEYQRVPSATQDPQPTAAENLFHDDSSDSDSDTNAG